MSYLNAPIPNFKCHVHESFFLDAEPTMGGGTVRAVAFGIVSRPGHALGVHVLTDRGVQWYGLPLHALCWKPDAPLRDLRELELWDCFSFHVSVTEFPLLSGLRCRVLPSGEGAECLFSLDWTHEGAEVDPGWARLPEEHKSGHFLRLDDGNFGLQPNNRLLWREESFAPKPYDLADAPRYRRNTKVWSVER